MTGFCGVRWHQEDGDGPRGLAAPAAFYEEFRVEGSGLRVQSLGFRVFLSARFDLMQYTSHFSLFARRARKPSAVNERGSE